MKKNNILLLLIPSLLGLAVWAQVKTNFNKESLPSSREISQADNLVSEGNYNLTASNATAIRNLSSVSITMTSMGCNGNYQYWNLSATPTNSGTGWYWSVGYAGSNTEIYIYNPTSPSTTVSVKGGGTVRLSYTDEWGVPHTDGVTIWSSCYSPYYYRASVSPNPDKDNSNVSLTPAEEGKPDAEVMQTTPLRI